MNKPNKPQPVTVVISSDDFQNLSLDDRRATLDELRKQDTPAPSRSQPADIYFVEN
jgi:hypothetical protein